jgi:hypothetical protein
LGIPHLHKPRSKCGSFPHLKRSAAEVTLQLSRISASTFLAAILITILFDKIAATLSPADPPSLSLWLPSVSALLPSLGRFFSRKFIPDLFALWVPAQNANFHLLQAHCRKHRAALLARLFLRGLNETAFFSRLVPIPL